MTQDEFHQGKLREVDLQGKTQEEWAEEIVKLWFPDIEKDDESYLDVFLWKFKNYVLLNKKLYEIIDHVKSNNPYYSLMNKLDDGTYQFSCRFSNGGTCLEEMLEDELTKINQ